MVWRLLSRRVSFNFSTWRGGEKKTGEEWRGGTTRREGREGGRVESGVRGEKRERVNKKEGNTKTERKKGGRMEEKRRADKGNTYYIIMPHPYPETT